MKRSIAMVCLLILLASLLTACADQSDFTALDGFYQLLEIETNSHNVVYKEHPYYITNGKIRELLQLERWEAVKAVESFEPVMDIPTGESEGLLLADGIACFYKPGFFQAKLEYYSIPQDVINNIIAHMETMK